MVSPTRKEPIWLKNKVLDCYPKSPPDGAKFYLTERFPSSCSSYWNWPFLSFHISAYKSISHPLSYGNTCWVSLPSFTCSIVPWILVPNCPGWFIIALFPIFGTALLYFSLADLGVRRLKKRLEDATVQASDHLSTNPEVADYLSQSDRQYRN